MVTNRSAFDSPDPKASLRYLEHLVTTSRKFFETPRSERSRNKQHIFAIFTTFHALRSQNAGKKCSLLRRLSLRGVSKKFPEVVIKCSKYLRDASRLELSNAHRFVIIRRVVKKWRGWEWQTAWFLLFLTLFKLSEAKMWVKRVFSFDSTDFVAPEKIF